ncbi:PTS sugar transporter subunit IIB [Paenibacillus xylaniclasticus]|uniref:PTS sugar transporter subunit IIB n=1 Tax=Paenibacillus xylaniclasticus TaxID=588083 RepID=UPI000FDBDCA0|nr:MULTISPECIES: PTS sugar transporter subunit IIB [Paenibacillus]GFN30133.1 PTS sugar transporter subunit IIB [Paenibacillus curdlanolyticus]
MKQIVVACNSGLGTSLMIRLNIEALMRELGLEVVVEHTDVTSLRAHNAKLIVCSSYIMDSIEVADDKEIIGLDDIMDRQYLKHELMNSKVFLKWLSETE